MLIKINNLPSGPDYLNTIVVRDVQNSNTVTSTGSFSLRVMKGTENEQDYAYFFGQIGFSGSSTTMGVSSVTATANDGPNLLATYRLTVAFAAGVIPQNGTMRVKVPAALTIDQTKVIVTTIPSLGAGVGTRFFRDYIILTGLTQQTLPSLIIDIQNLKNPAYSGNAGSFTVQLRSNGTEHVIETTTVGPTLVTVAQIPPQNVILTSFDIDVASMTLFSSDTVNYAISAKIVNTLPDDCGVVVEVPAAFTSISRCWAMDNLVDLSETAIITCTVVGNLLKLNNLRGVYKYKSIKVGMTATNPAAVTDTSVGAFNLFTYADRTFLNMVDRSSTPVSITIKGTSGTASTVTVPTVSIPSDTILPSLTVTFTAGNTFTDLRLKVFLASGFSNTNTGTNLVTCRVDKNSAAFVAAGSCSALINDKNFLEVNMVSTPSLGAAIATDSFSLVITPVTSQGLKTPLYAGKYHAQVLLSDISTLKTVGTVNFNVLEKDLDTSLMTVQPYTFDYDHIAVYDFAVYMPFGVEQGQWITKADIGLTYFEVRFSGGSFTNLLRNYTANAAMPCYGIVGLNRYLNRKGRRFLRRQQPSLPQYGRSDVHLYIHERLRPHRHTGTDQVPVSWPDKPAFCWSHVDYRCAGVQKVPPDHHTDPEGQQDCYRAQPVGHLRQPEQQRRRAGRSY